jgi:hypothetical protein
MRFMAGSVATEPLPFFYTEINCLTYARKCLEKASDVNVETHDFRKGYPYGQQPFFSLFGAVASSPLIGITF